MPDNLCLVPCCQCPNTWVVGLGMDTAQIYRSLPYVGSLSKKAQLRMQDDIQLKQEAQKKMVKSLKP